MTSNHRTPFSEFYLLIKQLVRWTLLIVPVAFMIGSTIALFLWLLHTAIQFRFSHTWLLYLLPLAGLFIHFIYQYLGKSAVKGNHLVFEEMHTEGAGVPARMAPIILFTTVLTHLFGGSAGREGTAVQIGGSMASMYGRWFKLKGTDMRMILTAGVAAGFGAVFGTPLTGAIFAIEVLTIGRLKYDAFLPALVAAAIGNITVNAWQVSHTHYQIDPLPALTSGLFYFNLWLFGKVMIASVTFGLASFLFAGMVQEIKVFCLKVFSQRWVIPIFGGLMIIGLTLMLGKPDYLSLGVNPEYPGAVTITSAFQEGGAETWSWLLKTIYTALTLGTGFKGGEVTPLFYIGATLGNTLAGIFNAPVSLFAALGFLAVFAGATNTPLACTFMGVELFGGQYVLWFALACFTAYLFSGHAGVYSTQRVALPKTVRTRRGYLDQKLRKYTSVFGKK